MTLEQFKLKQYRLLFRGIVEHMNNMQARRANANKVTLGFLDAIEEKYEKQLSTFKMRIEMLRPRKEGEITPFLTHAEIARAKLVPIGTFLKVPTHKKVNCLFHTDSVASMHIYGTTYYCFSCGARGTVCDIVMKLRNCSFSQAVKFLIGK